MPRGKRVRRNERAHGSGSVKDLPDGKVRAWRPPRTDGSRPSKLFSGPDARERAEAWLRGNQSGPALTLGQWCEAWYARRRATLRENSRRRYGHYFGYLGALATRPIAEISAEEWQAHLTLLLLGDQRLPVEQRTVYSRTTLDRARGIWSAALTAAVRAGHLRSNPLLDTILPTPNEQPPKAWRGDEVRRLFAAAAGHHHEAFLHLGLSTGLRLGELRALTWADVDLEALTVSVLKSMDNNTGAVGPTKTGRARIIPLPVETAALLSAHAKRQPLGTLLVIGKPEGAYRPSTLREWLGRVCVAAGVTPLPPHSMRHTFASLALADGVDLPALSQALGHANIIITGLVYSHFITRLDRPTARAISRRLYGSADPPSTRSAPGSAQSGRSDQEKSARV